MLAFGEREAMVMAPTPMCDSAVSPCFSGCLAFFHRHFPPQSPPQHPLNLSLHSRQQPSPWDCSPIHKLQLPATAPSRGPASLSWVYCSKDCLILIPFSLLQISCFTFSLKCFSSHSDNCLDVGMEPLLQFPHPPRAGPVLQTLLISPLVPSSYRVLHGSIYSFPLVGYSFRFLAGVLHALLCLKVYSWCIYGERHTPYSPTPMPSCSRSCFFFFF